MLKKITIIITLIGLCAALPVRAMDTEKTLRVEASDQEQEAKCIERIKNIINTYESDKKAKWIAYCICRRHKTILQKNPLLLDNLKQDNKELFQQVEEECKILNQLLSDAAKDETIQLITSDSNLNRLIKGDRSTKTFIKNNPIVKTRKRLVLSIGTVFVVATGLYCLYKHYSKSAINHEPSESDETEEIDNK